MTPDSFAVSPTAFQDLTTAMRSFGCTVAEAEASMRRLSALLAHPDVQAAYARASVRRARKRASKYLTNGGIK